MPRGGKRPGAGRPKGSPNRATAWREAQIKAAGKLTPLELFLSMMHDEGNSPEVRFMAAKEAAPYVHPRLASVEGWVTEKTHEQRLAELQKLLGDES